MYKCDPLYFHDFRCLILNIGCILCSFMCFSQRVRTFLFGLCLDIWIDCLLCLRGPCWLVIIIMNRNRVNRLTFGKVTHRILWRLKKYEMEWKRNKKNWNVLHRNTTSYFPLKYIQHKLKWYSKKILGQIFGNTP